MKTLSIIWSLVFACMLLYGPQSFAAGDTEAEIKQSLIERVSAVDALKLSQKAGENNLGLLVQRAALNPEETALLNAENKDRRALYAILAKRLGLTVKVVGQGRAAELREKSAEGVWLQDPEGRWYQQKK